MACRIIKDKRTDEEFLIPDCYAVGMNYHLAMPDRELIKEYCRCDRVKKDKYETKTRDEVFMIIKKLKEKVQLMENKLIDLKEDLAGMESEVFMLNSEEVELK